MLGLMEKLLPSDITLDILSRLPTESVLYCRRVCKAWRDLTFHPSFADMHLRHQLLLQPQEVPKYNNRSDTGDVHGLVPAAKVGFISLNRKRIGSEERDIKLLYYGVYQANNDEQKQAAYTKKLMRIHPTLGRDREFVGSCNGLICLSVRTKSCRCDPVYIFNPITREYIDLPKFMDLNNCWMVSGFGYDPSTNEYKVVRIYYAGLKRPIVGFNNVVPPNINVGRVQVYTLGSGSGWRNLGEISYKLLDINPHIPGIFVNGSLHWRLDNGREIWSFNLADEKFRVLPSPPCFGYSLGVLGGCLCLFQSSRNRFTVWSFKKKSSCHDDSKEEGGDYKSWGWSREFSIAKYMDDMCIYGLPFAFMKNGEVLWCSLSGILYRYDPTTASLEKLVDYSDGEDCCYRTITHMNSFVSLKSLGEDAKIIG